MSDKSMVVIGKQKTQGGVYHTRECSNYPEKAREVTQEYAQRRELSECKVCARNVDNRGKQPSPLAHKLEEMDPEEL